MRTQINVLVCIAAICLTQFPAQATFKSWNNASGGSWFSPGNWNPAGVPGSSDTASITLAGTYTVTIDSQGARIAVLVLGGTGGVQTLRIIPPADSLILATTSGGTFGQVNANGRLRVRRAVLALGPSCTLTSSGEVTVDSLGRLSLSEEATFTNDIGGTVTFSGKSGIYGYNPFAQDFVYVNNYGVMTKSGNDTLTLSCQYYQSSTGSFTLQSGVMQVWSFITNGPVTLASGTTTLLSLGGTNSSLEIDGSFVELQGTANILGSANIVNRSFLKHTLAGTSTISCNHSGATGGFQKVQVVAGKLSLTGSLNMMIDSVEIGPSAELETRNTYFQIWCSVVSTVPDSGTLTLTGLSNTTVQGSFTFSGNLDVNSYNVDFHPTTDPVSIHTFTIESGAQFVSTVTVNCDNVNMNGGSTTANVTVGSQYNWTAGTFNGDTGTTVAIDAGINLSVVGPQPKQLNTRDLLISGTANMSGSGSFSMSGGATITVNPLGSLTIGDSIAITGVGDSIINHGQMTFNCPLDTAKIQAFLYNKPTARTPGTIDILSGKAECGSGTNAGTVRIADGSKLVVDGTMTNNASGTITITGGAEIDGSGTLDNGGQVDRSGSVQLTTTNAIIGVVFHNFADSGFLDVSADTLTLLNGGTNAGSINIHSGAVLRILGTFTNLSTGVIHGGGVLDVSGAAFVNDGTIAPGSSPGALAVFGNLNTPGTIDIELAGCGQGTSYDLMTVFGNAALGGTLHLSRLNGFTPAMTDTFIFMLYNGYSGAFSEVAGTAIGDGRFMEVANRPSNMIQYVCNGISDISVTPVSILDSVQSGHQDTLALELCNSGHCPLEWTSDFIQTTPSSPPGPEWLTVLSGGSGLETRTQCTTMQFAFNASGLAPGTYTGQISISSNDPDETVTSIPVQLVVPNLVEYQIGGPAADFATFTEAATYLEDSGVCCPTILNVYAGTYEECVAIGSIPGASATNTIAFRANDFLSPPLIHCTAVSSPGVWLNGADHIIFDGINITKTSTTTLGYAVRLATDADSNTFRQLTVTGASLTSAMFSGINILSGCDGNIIENVSVLNCNTAIYLGSTSASSRNNEVRFCSIPECVYGVQIYRQSGRTVHDCDIQPGYSGLSTYGCRGVSIYNMAAGDTALIYNNRIHNLRTTYASGSSALGINAQFNAGLCRVYNNFIYDWHSSCPAIGVTATYDAPLEFCGNSVRINNVAVAAYGVYLPSGTGLAFVRNNILDVDGTDSVCYSIYNYGTLHNNCDYNCFYSSSSVYGVGLSNGTRCTTLSQWRTTSGLDAHSRQSNPVFCSPTDMHVERFAHSAADSAGGTLGYITSDIDGEPRGIPPDIGADEFSFVNDRVDNLIIKPEFASNSVGLYWSPVPCAHSYQVYYSDSTNHNLNPSHLLTVTPDTTCTHTGILSQTGVNHLYYHVVTSSATP